MTMDQVKLTGKQSLEHNRKGRQSNLSTYWMMSVIILEAVQSENPEYHLPKAAEKHRPKRKQQKDDASKKSKKKK